MLKTNLYILISLLLITNDVLAKVICSSTPKTECVEPGGTRYFDTVPVTLDCWRYKTSYECRSDASNNCQQLKDKGCSPISVTCKEMWGGICAVQEVTYDCPQQVCDGYEVVCNEKGKGFCLTGDCVSQTRNSDSDINKVLSSLTAAADASKEFSKNLTAFKSAPSECSRNALGFKNCCKEHGDGWGTDINLAECTGEEKTLALQKAEGLTAEIGEYCHNRVLGECTSYHRTYCVFTSKLGRILRVAARDQLGLGFGDPEHPNCSGITQEQFGKLDFSRIDFREFYKDIEQKMNAKSEDRSPVKVNQMIQQKSEALKAKVQTEAQKTRIRTDELRVRTNVL